jgi:hypothetical protein
LKDEGLQKTHSWRRGVVVAVCAMLLATSVRAQMPTGVIEGIVADVTGGVLSGAIVNVREPETNQTRTATTDSAGFFRFPQLSVGTYRLEVTYPAFTVSVEGGIGLTIGQTVHLTITLMPAGIAETVRVSAQPPPLDAHQTAVTTTIDNERIEELPVQSRDYLQFVLLAPGVAPAPAQATRQAASVLSDSGFSFAGLRPRSNTLTIDGLDNNDHYSGASRTELSLEIVREFRVVTNGYAAESGGASGGAINVVTKNGTNTIHGDAFLFGEFSSLDAPPPLEETLGIKPSLTRFRGGFSMGGPLIKDRTFYYGAFEREQTRGQTASDIDPHVVSTINAVLLPGFSALTNGLFPTSLTETEWSGKVNYAVTSADSLMVRVAGTDRSEMADAFNTSGLTDFGARGSSTARDTAVGATWTTVLGARATNDVRGQLAARHVGLSTTNVQGPGVSIAGVADFGRPYAGNDAHDQGYVELGDTFGWTRGSHFVKTGVDYANVAVTGSRTDGMGGLFEFPDVRTFLAGQPDMFRHVFGQSDVDFATNRTGVFVQDHWTPVSSVTIDAGLRFDVETAPATLDMTDRQWSPRLGVAWTPAGKWVVRGGAGRFADRLVLAAVEPALLLDGHHGFEQVIKGAAASALFNAKNAGSLAAPFPGVRPSIYTVQPGSWQPSSLRAGLGVEHQLTADLTASVNYLFVRGQSLARTVNVNLSPPTVLTLANAAALGVSIPTLQQLGRPVFGSSRVNPMFDSIFQLQPTALSTYHGVTAMLNRRLANEFEWSAAYTWSHSTDTASDFDEQPQNPYDLSSELSDSRYDQRHRLVISALFDLPVGEEEDRQPGDVAGAWTRVFSNIEMAPIFTLESGRPTNLVTGADDGLSGAYPLNARPLGSGRNSLRLPAYANLDVRALKFFNIKPHGKLDVVFEVFNLLNRTNITQLNTVYGTSLMPLQAFGQAVDAAAARRLQFSLDFEF